MEPQVDERLVYEVIEAAVDWRDECAEVWGAYARWASAPVADAAAAFSAYRAALDQEECASQAYADLLQRLLAMAPPLPRPSGVGSELTPRRTRARAPDLRR
jgi:hypothetical protein